MQSDRKKAACRNSVRHTLSCRNVEFPCMEIRKGLIKFILRIHDERPARSDRLVNWIGVPKQNYGIVNCLHFDRVAVVVQIHEIELRDSLPLDGNAAANDIQKAPPPRYTSEFHTTTGSQPDD